MSTSDLYYSFCRCPIGDLLLAGDSSALHLIGFPSGSRARRPDPGWQHNPAPFAEAERQLQAYFAGELRRFDLPLHFGGTDFQNQVWRELGNVPWGETITYGELARRLGRPTASRAVGAANGANPLPIIAPCHRVIGADGSLTGFGGGLDTKRFLLGLEGALPIDSQLELLPA